MRHGGGSDLERDVLPVDLTVIQQQKMGLGRATRGAVVREGGAAKMWRGTVSCAARESVYTAGYLGLDRC